MHVVFYTVKIVYVLYIYDLFVTLLSLWHTYEPMKCMYVRMYAISSVHMHAHKQIHTSCIISHAIIQFITLSFLNLIQVVKKLLPSRMWCHVVWKRYHCFQATCSIHIWDRFVPWWRQQCPCKQCCLYQTQLSETQISCSHCIRSTMDARAGECPPCAQAAQEDRLPLPSYGWVGKVLWPCGGAQDWQGPAGCPVWIWSDQGYVVSRWVWWQASGDLLWDQNMG